MKTRTLIIGTLVAFATILSSCKKSNLTDEKCQNNIEHYNQLVDEYNDKWQILTDNGEPIIDYWTGEDIWTDRNEMKNEIDEQLDEIYFDGCKYTEYDCDKYSGEYCYFEKK